MKSSTKTAIGRSLSTLIFIWVLGALFYLNNTHLFVRLPLVMTCLFGCFFFKNMQVTRSLSPVAFAGVLFVVLIWSFNPASNDRVWTKDQVRLPQAIFSEQTITLNNVRNCRYRSTSDFDVQWKTISIDSKQLKSLDFVVEHFSSIDGLAHTFLTFGFEDGQQVAISVEIRKEEGESFSPFAALFRNYELMYVIADERDLIGLRTEHRKNPLYLYPIKASKTQIQKLFVSMLHRANSLKQTPQYYNTLFNTCTTNIAKHLNENFEQNLGFDLRIVFPGYSDEIAHELGLINTNKSLEEAKIDFKINDAQPYLEDGKEWSTQLRKNRKVFEYQNSK